jgi:predicted nucleotidyltransferase component of viral defense system
MIEHPESVSPALLDLLWRISKVEELEAFLLGGGTSLALRFGHRRSIDLDFFTTDAFDTASLQNQLRLTFGNLEILNCTKGSLCIEIKGAKVDILHHPYPLLDRPSLLETVKCISLPDMAAMKINAITNRGSKKDFSDLLLLHEQAIQIPAALDYFCAKYGLAGRFLGIRSLSWFEDAEEEPDPVYLNGWTWEKVKKEFSNLMKDINE